MVLMIIGIIAGAVFKGQDLLESAKVRATLSDFNRYKMAVMFYQETYGALPGDDSEAQSRFGTDVSNGNGNGLIQGNEAAYFWVHLFKAGQVSSDKSPASKLGGKFSVVSDPTSQMSGNWLMLGKENGENADGALLTPKQAQMLKIKGDEGNTKPDEGVFRVTEGKGVSSGQCLRDHQFNLSNSAPACIILLQF